MPYPYYERKHTMMCTTTLKLVIDEAIGNESITTISTGIRVLNQYIQDIPERPLVIESTVTNERDAAARLADEIDLSKGLEHGKPCS